MYIVREIFYLKFGHYRDTKALVDEAITKKMFPEAKQSRILTDFTGTSYRMILESGFDSLAEFEKNLQMGMSAGNWNEWYHRFKQHVESSEREILKMV